MNDFKILGGSRYDDNVVRAVDMTEEYCRQVHPGEADFEMVL